MNKTEYVAAVADASGMTKAQAALAVDACTAVITKALKSGDAVQITGFKKSFQSAVSGIITKTHIVTYCSSYLT